MVPGGIEGGLVAREFGLAPGLGRGAGQGVEGRSLGEGRLREAPGQGQEGGELEAPGDLVGRVLGDDGGGV